MANFTKNYETTEIVENPNVLGGGARPLNTYDIDFGGIGQIHSPYGGKKPVGYNVPVLDTNTPETFTNVKCNDGITQRVGSNPLGARVDMPCKNNGGVSSNQDSPKEVANSSVNLSPEEKFYESLGLKDKGGLTLPLKSKGRLLVAVVLVAGYFAYKKFKK